MNRTEYINLKFQLNAKLAKQYEKQLASSGFNPVHHELNEGDTLKCDYNFYIQYIGNVERNLAFILQLMEEGIVVKSSAEEIRQGKSIILELARRLDELMQKLPPE